MRKVLIGLSGGVDSSVATHILLKEGYEVSGITMKIYDSKKYHNLPASKKESCFGGDEEKSIEDAKKVAEHYKIPFYVIDLVEEYENFILNYFREEYNSGRTPNPCIKCNRDMKFGLLLEYAMKSGINFDFFATGHYARVEFDKEKNRYILKKAKFIEKDQSYFLALLSQNQLSKVILPLGNYSKKEVREIALNLGLFTHDKIESQDFYSGDYTYLLKEKSKPGNIVDISGRILGKHNGIENFTIGQRKGLKISYSKPLYVVAIDKERNEVIVDTEEGLFNDTLIANNVNWLSIESLKEPIRAKVRIRYRHTEDDATIYPLSEDKIKVIFDRPQRAITPGQVAVIYNNDIVLGGGFIESFLK
ncbi:MAG TPA: tRNA 2-thiouridine(34) synthase MnmA [Spirochaetota bacterium]|nr:tRNA 2-thiouridine(34) synthase MnmA [Spirochaetota bacterium]